MKVVDPVRLAAAARSILSCPASVELVVDGVTLAADEQTSLREAGGVPTFTCALDATLSFAGAAGHSALIKLTSGLGPRGSAERADTLHLAGRLRTAGREACRCCDEVRDVVTLDLGYALLVRPGSETTPEERLRVPLAEFRSEAHALNRGYLQRTAEHANDCHQDELRRAVASRHQVRLGHIVAVRLAGITPEGLELDWVDPHGGHREQLHFPHPAATPDELAHLLRHQLHPGIC